MPLDDLISTLSLEEEARQRYSDGFADAQIRANRYENYHKYFAPPGGDQWSEDLTERPGKLHITVNIIRAFVDTQARLLAKEPRITLPITDGDEAKAKRAEATEKLFGLYRERSGFRRWSFTHNQVSSLYGMGVLKPFWNPKTNMPDVVVVEQPQNIMFGWGDSDFSSLDWAIYYYRISRKRAHILYPTLNEEDLIGEYGPITSGGGDHSDPLGTISMTSSLGRMPTSYEQSHVPVWDYWYVGDDDNVYNVILVNGKVASEVMAHPEMPTIPYIPIESEHEPGSPDGHGVAELLLDIQMGINRGASHYAQHVWDETDPAYQLVGPEAPTQVPPGLVPRSGELLAPGPNVRIDQIRTGVNNFPFDALLSRYWDLAHRTTGLGDILFGVAPPAQTSGRALQAQLDASINRLEPKRERYYEGLRQLMQFWHFMVSQKNPKIDGIGAKDVVKGLTNWHIVAPEITPRDVMEHTQNTLNKMNAKSISLETAMDELGVENPMEEIKKVMAERSNAHLFPGDAQAIAAVVATLQAIAAQSGAQGAAAQGQNAQDAAVQDEQQAQPTLSEDQNGPPTTLGGPPPPGGGIGGRIEPMVRQSGTGASQPMSQIILPKRGI